MAEDDIRALLKELIGATRANPPESEKAVASARKEYENDANRKDPKGTQGRVDAAIHELRKQWGLEK